MSTELHGSQLNTAPAELPSDQEPVGVMLRRVFLAWERLRVLFDGALILLVVGFAAFSPRMLTRMEFWIIAIQGAIMANLFYLAGPIYESYATWLGWRTKGLRPVLFIFGTTITAALTTLFLAGFR